MPSALIIGASRGLGRALAEEFAGRGWDVTATVRGETRPVHAGIEVVALDVADEAGPAWLAEQLSGRTLDLLFVNAGVSGAVPTPIGRVPTDEFTAVMVTNALGPLRLIDGLIDRIAPDGVVGVMTSDLGSIGRSAAGRAWETYRMSKAALNMGLCNLAHRHGGGRTFLAVAPGWVRTDMGGDNAALSVEESVRGLADVIEAEPVLGHRFVDHQGAALPW